MEIKIKVTNDKMEVGCISIVSGSKNYYVLKAEFSDDWEGLNKYAVFPSHDCSVEFAPNAVLPEGIIQSKGVLMFGIYGRSADGEVRISTNLCPLRIDPGVSEVSAPPPAPEGMSAWEKYFKELVKGCVEDLNIGLIKENVEKLQKQLGGISFAVDESGHITAGKE